MSDYESEAVLDEDDNEKFVVHMIFDEKEMSIRYQNWYDQQGRQLFIQWNAAMLFEALEQSKDLEEKGMLN